MKHYHKRSNVESAFSMMKRKFGNYLRARSSIGRENEVLCKAVCHNICVLIQEMFELGIIYHDRFSLRGEIATNLGVDEWYGILIVESIKYGVERYMVAIVAMISVDVELKNWRVDNDIISYKNIWGGPIAFLRMWNEFMNGYIERRSKKKGWDKNNADLLKWCKSNGFKGVCQACIDKAVAQGGNPSKMANFAINVSKGKYSHPKS